MPFTTDLTGTTETADSRVIAFEKAFILENEQAQILDSSIVTTITQINAKSFNFPRYAGLGLNVTPLVEVDDPASTAMSDTEVVLTPDQYGEVITVTDLADLQSGGQVGLAAAQLIGRQAGRTQDGVCMVAMDQAGAGQQIFAGAATGSGDVVPGDIADAVYFEDAYNKLARASSPAIGDMYIAVLHDDVISDLRDAVGAGSWTDINKYNNDERVLRNEVGMYKGFRIIRQNDATVDPDAGSGSVDAYNSYFIGFNGVGKAVSQVPSIRFINNDKMDRFTHVSWKGTFAYTIVEPAALVLGLSASSRGAN